MVPIAKKALQKVARSMIEVNSDHCQKPLRLFRGYQIIAVEASNYGTEGVSRAGESPTPL